MATPVARVALLEADLRSLSVESRKHYPDVKQSAERAILNLRQLHDTASDEQCLEALRSETVVRPFLVALATKNAQLVLLSLSALQKLASTNLLTSGAIAMLIGSLRILAETSPEGVLLKILQTLSLLASPSTFITGEEAITQALGICLRLHTSDSTIISNTAAATLSQVIDLIFSRAAKDHTDAVNDDGNLTPKLESAYRLLVDLVHLANGDPPDWLAVHGNVPRQTVLEMLNALLHDHSAFVRAHVVFVDVLRSQLRPLVMRLLGTADDFTVMLRLVRCVVVLVQQYHTVLIAESEAFLSLVIRMVEPEFQLWQRVLALEALKQFTSSPVLLVTFFQEFDCGQRSTKVFGSMCHALGRVAGQISLEGGRTSSFTRLWELHVRKGRGLELLGETSPPEYDDLYAIVVAMESLMNIVQALAKLAETDPPTEAVCGMLQASLSPVLASFTALLEHSVDDEMVQFFLIGLQSCSFTCGKLNAEDSLGEIVKTLCQFALPSVFRAAQQEAHTVSTGLHDVPGDPSTWILTAHNSQAMKSLFNVCHKLGPQLRSSWILVLKTFEQLDMILASQQVQSAVLPSDNVRRRAATEELAVLSAALAHLFSATVHLELPCLMNVMSALGTLSLSSLANVATADSTDAPHAMFALINLIKTVEHNLFRIGKLWEFVLGHLNCVVRHRGASIRAFGMQCFARLVKKALKQQADPKPVVEDNQSGLDDFGTSQTMFIVPMRSLLTVKYSDTGSSMLHSLYDVLQATGQAFNEGWPAVLDILGDVVDPDIAINKDFVPIGFKVVQLIVDDFLECMPLSSFEQLIVVAGMYGRQRCVTNTSFTATNLLWQVSDHVARIRSGVASPVASTQSLVYTLTNDRADDLQLAIFSELKSLSMDARSEVRNSAVQTLHSTIAACGTHMSEESWRRSRSHTLFPLLRSLFEPDHRKRALSLQSEAESNSQLGTDAGTGKQILMVIHHSRDTAEKQWDQTRVHALQGSSRVFRHHFAFHTSDEASEHWFEYLRILEQCITKESNEVAHSALESLQQILQSNNAVQVLVEHAQLKDAAIEVYTNSVDYAIQLPRNVPFDVYTSLLESVTSMLDESSCSNALFGAKDLLSFLKLADTLSSLKPAQAKKPVSATSLRETSLQRATLQLIGRLTIVKASPELYASVLQQVCSYVHADAPQVSSSGSSDSSPETVIAFAKCSLPVLVTLFCDRCPDVVQCLATLLRDMVLALHSIMCSGWIPKKSDLCREAVFAFIRIVEKGVLAVNDSGCTEEEAEALWSALETVVGEFLEPVPSASDDAAPMSIESVQFNDHLKDVESLQVKIVHLVFEQMLPNSDLCPEHVQRRLIELLSRKHESASVIGLKTAAAAHEPAAKTHLVQACMNGLFTLCSVPADVDSSKQSVLHKIARTAAPALLSRCDAVLRAYVTDERRSGQRPLPRNRREEMAFIMQRLLLLQLHQGVVPTVNRMGGPFDASGRKGHLLHLYPAFADCVCIREQQLQQLLRRIFHAIGQELQLEPPDVPT